MSTPSFQLARNPFGRLVLTQADGQIHENVVPIRAFPIQAPEHGLALLSEDGHEIAWVESLKDLPETLRTLIEEELRGREFMPEIERIHRVSSYATPSTWDVATHRGETRFVLRGEEDIRRIGQHTLLISDSHGIHFLVRDLNALDKHSRKILDRFL